MACCILSCIKPKDEDGEISKDLFFVDTRVGVCCGRMVRCNSRLTKERCSRVVDGVVGLLLMMAGPALWAPVGEPTNRNQYHFSTSQNIFLGVSGAVCAFGGGGMIMVTLLRWMCQSTDSSKDDNGEKSSLVKTNNVTTSTTSIGPQEKEKHNMIKRASLIYGISSLTFSTVGAVTLSLLNVDNLMCFAGATILTSGLILGTMSVLSCTERCEYID